MPITQPGETGRKAPRYAVEMEVHVAYDARHLVSLTREISRGGLFFFADPPPPVGERIRLTLYPDAHEPITVTTIVRYMLPGVGSGVEVQDDPPESIEQFRNFVDEQASSTEAWHVIGDFVRSVDSGEVPELADFEPKEMIDVGETGEAYRVFFGRYPPVPPEKTILKDRRDALAQAKLILSGVSSEPVGIKLNANDRLRRAHLGVLAKGAGYVAIVPPPQPGGRYSFYTLSGREQLMIKEGERSVYPFFTMSELARIRKNTVSAIDSGRRRAISSPDTQGSVSARYVEAQAAKASAPEIEEDDAPTVRIESPLHSIPELASWTRYSGDIEKVLTDLFDLLHAETRVYKVGGVDRPVRLIRNLKLVVREPDSDLHHQAMLIHDGKRVCVLINTPPPGGMQIRPLTSADEIRLPAW